MQLQPAFPIVALPKSLYHISATGNTLVAPEKPHRRSLIPVDYYEEILYRLSPACVIGRYLAACCRHIIMCLAGHNGPECGLHGVKTNMNYWLPQLIDSHHGISVLRSFIHPNHIESAAMMANRHQQAV